MKPESPRLSAAAAALVRRQPAGAAPSRCASPTRAMRSRWTRTRSTSRCS